MKIIIIGTGKVGFSLAEQLLNEKHDITIVDTQDSALHRATDALDIMSVKGNGVSTDTLREAGAEDADLLVAATNSDEVNMVCCLTAKHLGAKYTIARIRNPEYNLGLHELKKNMGIDMVINPENATAVEISRLLRFPSAANIETFCRGRVELMGFRLQEGDFLVNQPLHALSAQVKQLSLLVCAVDRDGEELVGKTLIAITNLPPRKMMGIDSCGMIISAIHHEEGVEKLHCLMVDDHIPAGAKLY